MALAVCAWGVVHSLPHGDAVAAPVVARTEIVESISIDGGRGLPIAQLRSTLQTKLGDRVDPMKLEQDRAALQHHLAARGYLAARVGAPVVTFGKTGGTYVVFDVVAGPLYHIGAIELRGPSWSHAGVVTLASGDEAVSDRFERSRQAAEDTLARHGKPSRVQLVLHPDPATALVDVQLVSE
ncbi:MAG TPA: POTRA domain-containing protein [Kofleriaceae bacterium]|nr:POTRA domain-containing protein [Kofleriaceae bacterium]